MILLAILALSLQTPDPALATMVSLTSPAIRVDKALKALGLSAGVALTASQNLHQENLLLRLERTPLSDVMTRIARACGGRWHKTSAGYILARDESFEKEETIRHQAELTASIESALKKIGERVALMNAFDVPYADELITEGRKFSKNIRNASGQVDNGFLNRLPQSRFEDRVTAALDPADLATTPLGERRVFAVDPTAVEKPLHGDFQAAIDGYVKEQTVLADEINSLGDRDVGLRKDQMDRISSTPDRLVICGTCWDSGDLYCRGLLYDSGHRLLAEMFRTLDLGSATKLEEPPTDKVGKPISLPTDQDAFARKTAEAFGVRPGRAKQARTELTGELIDRVSKPGQYEPLGDFPSTYILKTAEKMNLQVVADLPDFYFYFFSSMYANGPVTAEETFKFIQRFSAAVTTEITDRWLEIDGAKTSVYYSGRDNRDALTNLLFAAKTGRVSIEDRVRYGATWESGSKDYLWLNLLGALSPARALRTAGHDMLLSRLANAILASIGDTFTPFSINISKLPPDVTRELFDVVYNSEQNFSSNGVPGFVVSEAFPNGLPPGGMLRVRVTTEPLLFKEDHRVGSGPGYMDGRPLETIANIIFAKSRPEYGAGNQPDPTLGRFRAGERRRVEINIELAPGIESSNRLVEDQVGVGSFVSFQDLPEAYRNEIRKLVEEYQKGASLVISSVRLRSIALAGPLHLLL